MIISEEEIMRTIITLAVLILFASSVVADEQVIEWKTRLADLEDKYEKQKTWHWTSIAASGAGAIGILYGISVLAQPADDYDYSEDQKPVIGWTSLGIAIPLAGGGLWGALSTQRRMDSTESRIEELERKVSERLQEDWGSVPEHDVDSREGEAILNEEIYVGMSTSAVRQSLGEPDDINRTVTEYGTREQWVYEDRDMYVYIEDGVVQSWQE
jgi:tetrahydromethanopterin S-methyltransferase subunit G